MWNVQESNTVLEEGIHLILGAERAEREWHRFQDARFGGTEKIGGFMSRVCTHMTGKADCWFLGFLG